MHVQYPEFLSYKQLVYKKEILCCVTLWLADVLSRSYPFLWLLPILTQTVAFAYSHLTNLQASSPSLCLSGSLVSDRLRDTLKAVARTFASMSQLPGVVRFIYVFPPTIGLVCFLSLPNWAQLMAERKSDSDRCIFQRALLNQTAWASHACILTTRKGKRTCLIPFLNPTAH